MQWNHVLVGVDGTGLARHALNITGALAHEHRFRLTVVTILPPHDRLPPSLVRYAPVILHGHPGVEIARLAEQLDADLIVLGRSPHRGPVNPWLGSTAEAVVRRSSVPCLLIPEGQGHFHHVIAALDGTERGFAVLDTAIALSQVLGAALEIITVESSESAGSPVPETRTLRIAAELQRRSQSVTFPPLEVLHGVPSVAVQDRLNAAGSNLLVIGVRRNGPRGGISDSSGTGRTILQSVGSSVFTVPL
jgi:nucleotide-binding universal stress UspA family protein